MWDLLTTEELAWRERCRAFATSVIEPHYRRYDRENCFPREVHEAAYDQGFMNIGFDVELGGQGLGQRALVVGGEELAAVCAPTAFSMGFNHGALRPVVLFGTDEQKQVLIRDRLANREYTSLCLTEAASSGSNLMAIGTRAVRTDAGWVISGSKCMVGNGCVSNAYLVLANAFEGSAKRGLTFFFVPRGDGVVVGENTDKIGFRAVTTPTVEFEGVEICDDYRVGAVGGAEPILLATLDFMRSGGAAVILGNVLGALREVVAWVDARKTFGGESLGQKSHVQLELGAIFAKLRGVRLLAWRAAELLDAGKPCSVEVSMAKLAASELAVSATNAILQMYGWRGIDNDYSIQKRVRDARCTTIFEGTSEVQLISLFRELRQCAAKGDI